VSIGIGTLLQGNVATAGTLPEIVIWIKAGPEADALKEAAQGYTQKTGNPVNVTILGRSGFRNKYETTLLSGSAEVDGIHDISRPVPGLAAGGLLAPLDAFITQSTHYNIADIPEIVQQEMKFDGKWYMAPTDTSLETLVYRTDLILEPPATWEALRENALKFTQSINANSPTKYGYAYSAGDTNMIGTWQGIMGGYGGGILDAKGCVVLDTPQSIESFTFLINLKNKDKVTPPDISAWDYPELLVGLQEGLLAQASFFTAGMPVLTDCKQSAKVCKNVALVPQPAGPQGAWTRVNPLGIMVNAASKKKEATWAFLEWVTGPEGAMVYTKAGGTSPRTSVLSDSDLQGTRPWLPAVKVAMQHGVGSLRHARSKEISEVFARWVGPAVAGQTTPEEALKAAAKELRAMLNDPQCK
jgi:multiple sugar transport system substrate-binding protein